MKNLNIFKRLTAFLLAACLLLTFTACGEEPAEETGAPAPTTTTTAPTEPVQPELTSVAVTVKNDRGTPLEGVQVYAYADDTLQEMVSFAQTDAEGKATCSIAGASNVVTLSGIAPGYKAEAFYPVTGEQTDIVLSPLAPTEAGKLPTNAKFELGAPMMDFTLTDLEGNTYTASEVLKEKKAIVLNFWYTTCGPCAAEFPYLQSAYDAYKDSVLLLAVNPYETDNADTIKAFRDQHELAMPMVDADPSWATAMNVAAYPTTVVIDRYGYIAFSHEGSITEEGVFERLMACYGAEAYEQLITDDLTLLPLTEAEKPKEDEEGLIYDNEKEPIEFGSVLHFEAKIPAGKTTYYNVYRVSGTILTLKSKDAEIVYNGKTYTPKNGVISFPVVTDDVTIPVNLAITNKGDKTATFDVDFAYPAGTLDNPLSLKVGDFTTKVEKGNEKGVVYEMKATKDGVIEMYVKSATKGVKYGYSLFNKRNSAMRNSDEDAVKSGAKQIVSIEVKKGDVLQVVVSTLPNEKNEYPAATIKCHINYKAGAVTTTKPTIKKVDYKITVKAGSEKLSDVELTFTVGKDTKKVKTNSKGVATAKLPAGECSVNLTCPFGYVARTLLYFLDESEPTLTIELEVDDIFGDFFPEEPDDSTTESTTDPTKKTTGKTTTKKTTGKVTDSNGKTTTTKRVTTTTKKPTTTKDDGITTYTVKVIDGSGKAQKGITVSFYQGTKKVGSAKTDSKGVATAKLADGNYILQLTGTSLKYDARTAVVTKARNSVEILLAKERGTAKEKITCPLTEKSKAAYVVEEGATYVTLKPGERNYFLFTPERNGVFRISGSNSYAAVGYYGGAIHFIQTANLATDLKNNAFTVEAKDVGPTFVIGIDAATNIEGAVLRIVRTGDPGWSEADEPWQTYKGTHTPKNYTLPKNTKLKEVDITKNFTLVYNSKDGYYHKGSKDGPLVYLRFGAKSPYVAFTDILSNFHVAAYIYDAAGNFVKKEEYTECMEAYSACADATETVYPLTKDLEYIIKSYGEHQGWWDANSPGYLFEDEEGNPLPGINLDIAWMFALCYAD